MRQLKIAIDVDDVLAEHAAGFVEFSNQHWGTSLTVDDYDDHWAKMWQIDDEELVRRSREFIDSSIIASYGHIRGAHQVLTKLAKNHNLIVVTSRRLQMKNDTMMWIEQHFPGIFSSQEVYFSSIWDGSSKRQAHTLTKTELVSSLEADVLIDDQLKHCLAVADSGRKAILFGDYSWNQAEELPGNVSRCRDWYEVEGEIERIARQ